MKFGRIKQQHGRVAGLDAVLNDIIRQCPLVSRIVPGRIKVRRGKGKRGLKLQYQTSAGLKCLYMGPGTVQEVFLVCTDAPKTAQWLSDHGFTEPKITMTAAGQRIMIVPDERKPAKRRSQGS